MSIEHEQPSAPAKIWDWKKTAGYAGRAVMRFVSIPVLVAVVLSVIVLHYFEVINVPFDPLATRGAIYVDSPEVYTRERLVNDRYDQDHWLRQKLDDLDKAKNLLTAHLEQRAAVGRAMNPETPGAQPEEDAANLLPFDQEFRIRAAVRDAIRQLMLENMLDDRHDLTGNSVYGLKFDTTVIPGTSTHQRAFVRIRLTAPEPFAADLTTRVKLDDAKSQTIPKFLFEYYREGETWDARYGADGVLQEAYLRYQGWLGDIETRLNRTWLESLEMSNRRCETVPSGNGSGDAARDFIDDLTKKTIELVLGVPSDRVDIQEQKAGVASPPESPTPEVTDQEQEPGVASPPESPTPEVTDQEQEPGVASPQEPPTSELTDHIEVPDPWSRYMRIERERHAQDGIAYSCSDRPLFAVSMIFDSLNVIETVDGILPAWAMTRHVAFYPAGENKQLTIRIPSNGSESIDYSKLAPRFKLEDDTLSYIFSQKRLVKSCDFGFVGTKDCDGRTYEYFTVPSGLFNFITDVSNTDAYSYAIFPRDDVVGVMSDAAVEVAVPRENDARDWFNFVQRLRESETASILVGFGDSRATSTAGSDGGSSQSQRTVEFGWVLSARGDMEPTQKAQMALVSVPAWAEKLLLRIKVGWLDRNSREEIQQGPFDIEVALPATIEAFDSLLRGRKIPRVPQILDDFMDSNIVVSACRQARILILGLRLWRSASVTLGAQMADRITVLPNMEGIIATFNKVEMPHSAGEGDSIDQPCSPAGSDTGFSACLPLRVWTSEGMDRAPADVRVRVTEDAGLDCLE